MWFLNNKNIKNDVKMTAWTKTGNNGKSSAVIDISQVVISAT